jgi:mono/diheme cytochrome c family protein
MLQHDRQRQWTMALWVLLLWIASLGLMAESQTTGSRLPPLVIKSLGGPELFHFYCASCHGDTGMGNGPVASELKRPPANLTLLARSHGGVFPRERVRQVIAGDDSVSATATHGSPTMPVWGPIFRALDPDDRYAAVRIENLVSFLESIQAK